MSESEFNPKTHPLADPLWYIALAKTAADLAALAAKIRDVSVMDALFAHLRREVDLLVRAVDCGPEEMAVPAQVPEVKAVIGVDEGEFTSSLEIAEIFDRNHGHVLRGTRALCKRMAIDPNYRARHFRWDTYKDTRGRHQPMVWFSDKGLALLALGFTGVESLPPRVDLSNELIDEPGFSGSLTDAKEMQ